MPYLFLEIKIAGLAFYRQPLDVILFGNIKNNYLAAFGCCIFLDAKNYCLGLQPSHLLDTKFAFGW
jgi:hypothetical protein